MFGYVYMHSKQGFVMKLFGFRTVLRYYERIDFLAPPLFVVTNYLMNHDLSSAVLAVATP